ncbi:uncharacterized protein METZ01_LOCUS146999 [marine metagenome]|uniref:Uncharacterized protein n=1 Tax=marine metagenome TaxID=408172 RepID=A0A381ZXV5_9ZZZZ
MKEVRIPDLVVLLNVNLNKKNNKRATNSDDVTGTNVSKNHTSCLFRL